MRRCMVTLKRYVTCIHVCHNNKNASKTDNDNFLMNSPVGEKAVDGLFASPCYHHGTDGPPHTRIPGCTGGSGQLWSTHVQRQKSDQHHQNTSKYCHEFKTQWHHIEEWSWRVPVLVIIIRDFNFCLTGRSDKHLFRALWTGRRHSDNDHQR